MEREWVGYDHRLRGVLSPCCRGPTGVWRCVCDGRCSLGTDQLVQAPSVQLTLIFFSLRALADDDFSTHFQLHHDTPSKFFGPASPWALSLSPSVFFGRVNTPSMSTESNPFEVSFHPSTKSKPVLDDWDIDRTPGPTSLPRRKRAMSSPAVPPGASGFNLSFDASVDISSTFKRPRMSLPDANATDSSNSPSSAADSFLRNVVESGAGGESDTSPDSSSVFTPPESTLLPPTTYNFEKSSTSDPIESLSLSDFFDQGISYQSVLSSALPPLDPTTRHTSYEQFVFPPTVSTVPASTIDGSGVRRSVDHVSPFIFHLERERNLLQLNGPGYGQQLPPPPPVDFHPSPHAQIRSPVAANAPAAASPPATRAAAKGKKDAAKGKKGKRGKKGEVEEEEEEQEGEEGEDEEARRKMFLERNRIAACKSRQKKKERVGNLESREYFSLLPTRLTPSFSPVAL